MLRHKLCSVREAGEKGDITGGPSWADNRYDWQIYHREWKATSFIQDSSWWWQKSVADRIQLSLMIVILSRSCSPFVSQHVLKSVQILAICWLMYYLYLSTLLVPVPWSRRCSCFVQCVSAEPSTYQVISTQLRHKQQIHDCVNKWGQSVPFWPLRELLQGPALGSIWPQALCPACLFISIWNHYLGAQALDRIIAKLKIKACGQAALCVQSSCSSAFCFAQGRHKIEREVERHLKKTSGPESAMSVILSMLQKLWAWVNTPMPSLEAGYLSIVDGTLGSPYLV